MSEATPPKHNPHSPTKAAFTITPINSPAGGAIPPETFRLPKRGGDPHFGLTRGWFYAAEKQGIIKLIRLRQRGKLRGVVLVPYDAVKQLIEEAMKEEADEHK